jgi:broad specificity phosphatase PhoE
MALTLEIFIHMDAVSRNEWTGHGDDRPLTELGKQQSQRIAEEMTAAGPIAALYSSPAVRCRESLTQLAEKTGLPVQIAALFKDTQGYKAPAGWEHGDGKGPDPLGGAQSAGSAFRSLTNMHEAVPDGGRAVLCSYGDIVPALLAFLSGANGLDMPPRLDKKGAVYTVVFDGDKASLSHRDASEGFPA